MLCSHIHRPGLLSDPPPPSPISSIEKREDLVWGAGALLGWVGARARRRSQNQTSMRAYMHVAINGTSRIPLQPCSRIGSCTGLFAARLLWMAVVCSRGPWCWGKGAPHPRHKAPAKTRTLTVPSSDKAAARTSVSRWDGVEGHLVLVGSPVCDTPFGIGLGDQWVHEA